MGIYQSLLITDGNCCRIKAKHSAEIACVTEATLNCTVCQNKIILYTIYKTKKVIRLGIMSSVNVC